MTIIIDSYQRFASPSVPVQYPPIAIPSSSWIGTPPSFYYEVEGGSASYGIGRYDITSSALTSFTNYNVSLLFDGVLNTGSTSFYFTAPNSFIQIKLPQAITLTSYTLNPLTGLGAPSTWTLQGSNDGSTWTNIGATVTGAALTNSGATGITTNVSGAPQYNHFRITFPESGNLYVKQWRLFGF